MRQEPACNSSVLLLELFEKFPLAYKTKQCIFKLFTPGNFAEKRVLQLVEPFSGHSGYQELKLTKQPFPGCSIPNAQYQLAKFEHAQKHFGCKGTQQS